MSANDKLEKVLRDIHVLISKSEVYSGDSIIVSRTELLELTERLNSSVYDIMDEYELTKQSRDKAEREFKRRGDKIIFDAERKAEDVYAAAVMYTDEALSHLTSIIDESMQQIEAVQKNMIDDLDDKKKQIRDNQMELKSQLQDLVDTGKYLQLIEERNREIRQEQELFKTRFGGQKTQADDQFANVKTEIKINKQYFKEHGLAVDDDDEEEEEAASSKKPRKGKKLSGKKAVEKPAKKQHQTILKTARELVMNDEQKKIKEREEEYRYDNETDIVSDERSEAGIEPDIRSGFEPVTDPAVRSNYNDEPEPDPDVRPRYENEPGAEFRSRFVDEPESDFRSKFEDEPEPEVFPEAEYEYKPENDAADNEPGSVDTDELAAAITDHELSEEEIRALSDELDSEYFDWSSDE